MKLLFVGDVHMGDRPPSTRTESYREDIFAKLVEVGFIAIQREVAAVVFLGDIFHSKVPKNTSHETVQRLVGMLRGWPMDVYCVPGNHDYYGANEISILRAPLGVLWESEAMELFGLKESRVIAVGGVTLYGVREEEPIEAFSNAVADIVVAHSPIVPEAGDVPYTVYDAGEVAKQLPDRVKVVVCGHLHEPREPYARAGRLFLHPGSLSRGSLFEEHPDRVPRVLLLDVADPSAPHVEWIPLQSARPWTEVFRVAEVEAERERDHDAIEFAKMLQAASLETFNVEAVIAKIRAAEGVPEPVKVTAVELIEEQA